MVKQKPITDSMVQTLKRYGNLYVKDIKEISLDKLQRIIGFELNYRQCADGDGYVLERK